MKVAVINFSGNVGKTTIARHLFAPRIAGAEVVAIESINADDGQGRRYAAASSASCRSSCRPSTTSSSTSAPATSRSRWR